MKSTISYLDEAKAKLGIESDYGMAAWLGVTRAAVSAYRNSARTVDDYAAAKIAEVLEIDPMIVIAAANAEREKDDGKRGYWEKYYKRLGGIAASIIFAVTFIVTPTPSQAAPVLKAVSQYCILCKIARHINKVIKETALFLVSQISHFRMLVPSVG